MKIWSILDNYWEIYTSRDGRRGVKRPRQRQNMTMLEKTQALLMIESVLFIEILVYW